MPGEARDLLKPLVRSETRRERARLRPVASLAGRPPRPGKPRADGDVAQSLDELAQILDRATGLRSSRGEGSPEGIAAHPGAASGDGCSRSGEQGFACEPAWLFSASGEWLGSGKKKAPFPGP
jgi:hypothetical protein